jgi:hypothetical protein
MKENNAIKGENNMPYFDLFRDSISLRGINEKLYCVQIRVLNKGVRHT